MSGICLESVIRCRWAKENAPWGGGSFGFARSVHSGHVPQCGRSMIQIERSSRPDSSGQLLCCFVQIHACISSSTALHQTGALLSVFIPVFRMFYDADARKWGEMRRDEDPGSPRRRANQPPPRSLGFVVRTPRHVYSHAAPDKKVKIENRIEAPFRAGL